MKKIALNQDIIEATRRGMLVEPNNYRKAAAESRIGRESYKFIRKLLILESRVTDPDHRAVIVEALKKVKEDRTTQGALKMAKTVIDQYWHRGCQFPVWHVRRHGKKSLIHKKKTNGGHFLEAKFERAMLGISINCDCDDVVIPAGLSLRDVKTALKTVAEGRRKLRQFWHRLQAQRDILEPGAVDEIVEDRQEEAA